MWLLNRYWRKRLRAWPDLTESFGDSRLPIDAPAGGLDAVVAAGQGSQSVAAVSSAATSAPATVGQGSQSVAAQAAIATDSAAALGQGSQSVAAIGSVSIAGIASTGQGSQSVAALGAVSIAGVINVGQGSQSVAAAATVALDSAATTGQGSQSIAARDSGVAALDASVTAGQGGQSTVALVAISGGDVVVSIPAAGGSGRARLRYPKVRIATTLLPEGPPPISARAATGQGGQSVAALGAVSVDLAAATGQGGQRVNAQADWLNLPLLHAEDEFWLIAA